MGSPTGLILVTHFVPSCYAVISMDFAEHHGCDSSGIEENISTSLFQNKGESCDSLHLLWGNQRADWSQEQCGIG